MAWMQGIESWLIKSQACALGKNTHVLRSKVVQHGHSAREVIQGINGHDHSPVTSKLQPLCAGAAPTGAF